MGVTYEKARNKYRAVYYKDGKAVHVGRFDTKLKATRALNKARSVQESDKLEEQRFEEAFDAIRNTDYPLEPSDKFDLEQMYKPSIWDRIKSIWRSIRQQS